MQQLNKQATEIFSRLLARIKNAQEITLTRKHASDVVFSRLPGLVKMETGIGQYYRLTTYTNMGEKKIADPQLQFIVVDNRINGEMEILSVYPMSCRLPFFKTKIKAILVKEESIVHVQSLLLADLCLYTEYYLPNIQHNYLQSTLLSRLWHKKRIHR